MSTRHLLLPILLAMALAGTPATAPLAQSSWEEDLAAEIQVMEDCTVSFLSQIVERQVDGRSLIMAKVHCEDGRTFDATRDDSFAAFEFRACEPEEKPAVC
ncbi:MAG: hypothetical protein R3D25_11555 [Geminicoccaceae bacterium]